MKYWILAYKADRYEVHKFFKEQGSCLWNQRRDFNVGDIIYLYETAPVKQITYKAVVEEINIKRDVNRLEDDFYSRDYNKDFDCRLKCVATNKTDRLKFKELNEKFHMSGWTLMRIPVVTYEEIITYFEDVFSGKVKSTPTKEELYQPLMYGTMLEHIKHKMDFCMIRDSHLAKKIGVGPGTVNRARNGEAVKVEYVLLMLDALGFGFVDNENPNTFIKCNDIAEAIKAKVLQSGMRPTDLSLLCNASISVISHFKNDGVLPKLDVFKMLLTHFNYRVVYSRDYNDNKQ